MSLKDDLIIDPFKLDEEWIKLPTLYHNYMEEKEVIESEIKKIKRKLSIQIASLQKSIRIDPQAYGIKGKPLEKHIESMVQSDDFVVKMEKDLIKLDKEKRLYDAAIKSLEMKKDALKHLSSLYTTQYYTAPTRKQADNFISKQEIASNKESRQEVKNSLKRRAKKGKEDGTK